VGIEHVLFSFVILFFVLLASLTVMNMLVGVLIEVVGVVSAVEKEQLKVTFVKTKLMELMEATGFEVDNGTMITRREFANLLSNADAVRIIQDIGVDPIGLVDFTDHIFRDDIDGLEGEGLSFADFMEVIMQFRGKNGSTVKDIVDLRKVMVKEIGELGMYLSDLDRKIAHISGHFIEQRSTRRSQINGNLLR